MKKQEIYCSEDSSDCLVKTPSFTAAFKCGPSKLEGGGGGIFDRNDTALTRRTSESEVLVRENRKEKTAGAA